MSEAPAPPSGPAVDGEAPEGLGDWHRVHPLTPVIRSWQGLVVLVVIVANMLGTNVIEGDGGGKLSRDVRRVDLTAFVTGVGALILGVLAIVGLAGYVSWRMTRYRIGEEALELHTGVFNRQQRSARLDRLQAVDIAQPFLARIVGLARLTLEVAGAGDSKIALAYLREDDAARLRNHLLARAAGLRYDRGEDAPQAPEREVLHVPPTRLVASLVLSAGTVVIGIVIVASVLATGILRNLAPLATVVPFLLGLAGAWWTRFNGAFNFRLAASPDGMRLRHGLLEHRAQTVPPGRVQALAVRQPLLWRIPDWWSVRVNVAGYGASPDSSEGTESVLLPVGSRADVLQVLALALPSLAADGSDIDPKVVEHGMTGSGSAGGFVTSPRAAAWLDPLGWRRSGYRVTGPALLTRAGALYRRLDVVPHERVQSCGGSQGVLQRRLGLASVAVHSTPGPVHPAVHHLDSAVAARLLDEQAARARRARATAEPERWMAAPEHGE